MVNKNLFKQINKSNLIDIVHRLRYAKSTGDIRNILLNRISETIDNKIICRVISVENSNAFDKMWHMGLLHKLSSLEIPGIDISSFKSFLSDMSMNMFFNEQSSEAHKTKAGNASYSPLGRMYYINDLDKNILRSILEMHR